MGKFVQLEYQRREYDSDKTVTGMLIVNLDYIYGANPSLNSVLCHTGNYNLTERGWSVFIDAIEKGSDLPTEDSKPSAEATND